ncbi:hypothetical protein [Mesorhizobium sp. M0802]|uniref:hypothetical protein n=1 Tax=Mesorhizobium sp. M0802 TaxID=2957001 RepID=UPI00333DCA7A
MQQKLLQPSALAGMIGGASAWDHPGMDRTPINDVRTKIDQTPDEGLPALQRAYDQVKAKRFTQLQMLAELNAAFEKVGLPRVAPSTFNRWVLQIRRGDTRRPTISLPGLPVDKQAMRSQATELRQSATRLNQIADELDPNN